MISIVLLMKIIGGICFAAGWICICLTVRRTRRQMTCLRAYCDARLDALAQFTGLMEGGGAPEAELEETRRKALEAERRFTEGIASILNFSYMPKSVTPADMMAANDSNIFNEGAGRKGE